MQKILITGGDGFIARSLCEGFQDSFSVISANRHVLDLTDSEKVSNFLKHNHFDVVIHTATYDAAPLFSTKDPTRVLETNLKMFFNIVRCSDIFGKMIYFGSGAEFSREHWKPKMKEDYFDVHVPNDPYGFSKYLMSKYTQIDSNIYNLRLFGVFGKYDDWRYRFIPNVCCQAVFDMPITINENAIFDFLYIDDLLKIVHWFVKNKPSRNIYNVCTGRTYDFVTLAEKVASISGKDIKIELKTEGAGKEYSGDNSLVMQELKGFEFIPIDQSIEDLYKWYEQNIDLIDKNQLH
ncbi:MAG: NAD(P)-dependent oxidoreductase [Thermodesulfobacteriota bacterium]|jgi:GDP-L-fucose synthase|nr:NAD(P)-dependent oxidoreductase [Thermodesulfobacteriota bacterium]